MRSWNVTWLINATLLSAPIPLLAQEARTTMLERVIDSTGGVVSGAVLEAANSATGVGQTLSLTPAATLCLLKK